ncbi:hypothetical protein AVEN_53075-1 [Araneus ventricosus]|uniref:Uncharacterized protein n=1 Tax=Araneus ventricosus TaxID=182803 RepID=A0A4Y2HY18_ARAVE|nr:hypothetical protein AVEN_53075-1 [Araneus ventricosus]
MPNEEDLSAPSAFLEGLLRAAGPHSCEARGNQANPAQPARRRAAFHSRGLRLPVERASALGHWWGAEGALLRCAKVQLDWTRRFDVILWATSRSRVPVDGAAIASDVRGSSCREQTRRDETHKRRWFFFPDKD